MNPTAVHFRSASHAKTTKKNTSACSRASATYGSSSLVRVAVMAAAATSARKTPSSNFSCDATRYGIRRNGFAGSGIFLRRRARSTVLHISPHSFCASVRSSELVWLSVRIRENW